MKFSYPPPAGSGLQPEPINLIQAIASYIIDGEINHIKRRVQVINLNPLWDFIDFPTNTALNTNSI